MSLQRALAAAEGIGDAESRAQALSGVAQALAQVGEQGTGGEVLQRARRGQRGGGGGHRRPESRAQALSGVAQALAQVGDFERALAAAEGIGNEGSRAQALTRRGRGPGPGRRLERASEGLQRALAAAAGIGDEGSRAEALSGVAQALAQVGDREGLQRALAAAEGIGDEGGVRRR